MTIINSFTTFVFLVVVWVLSNVCHDEEKSCSELYSWISMQYKHSMDANICTTLLCFGCGCFIP